MAQGNYDHPSYITRVSFAMGKSTAGANGTSAGQPLIYDTRVRTMAALVNTAGTTAGNSAILFAVGQTVTGYNLIPQVLTTSTALATTTLGSVTLTTSTANVVAVSTDMNARVLAGGALFLKNGTDATGVYTVNVEANIDPLATWTGP